MTQQTTSKRPGFLRRISHWWGRVEAAVDRIYIPFSKLGKIISIAMIVLGMLAYAGYQTGAIPTIWEYVNPAVPCHKSVQPLWNLFKAKLAEVKAANPKEESGEALWMIAFREGLMGVKICLQLPLIEPPSNKGSFLFQSRADGMEFLVAVPRDELEGNLGAVKPLQELRIEGRLAQLLDGASDGLIFVVGKARITPAW